MTITDFVTFGNACFELKVKCCYTPIISTSGSHITPTRPSCLQPEQYLPNFHIIHNSLVYPPSPIFSLCTSTLPFFLALQFLFIIHHPFLPFLIAGPALHSSPKFISYAWFKFNIQSQLCSLNLCCWPVLLDV